VGVLRWSPTVLDIQHLTLAHTGETSSRSCSIGSPPVISTSPPVGTKPFVEGARALGLWVSLQLDIEEHSADPKEREAANDLLALMTPIVKSYFTDAGFEAANTSMQVWGGHGYIHENWAEQFVRDARITQIYEGANGIQALDLVGRKLPANLGRSLRRFFHPVAKFIEANQGDAEFGELLLPFAKAFASCSRRPASSPRKAW